MYRRMNKNLNRKPHVIDEKSWWYEENRGISIIIEPHDGTTEKRINWRVIRSALKRKDAV